MKKGRYKNLFSNMMIFTIGNLCSKLLVFLLVPFYTNVLTTSEYGIADGMQATLLLLVPLLSLNAGEAVLRFGLEKNAKHGSILKIGLKYVFYADILVFAVCGMASLITKSTAWREYFILFFFLFICNSLYEFVLLFCQGAECLKIMIGGSILSTFLVVTSNIYFLLIARIGLKGYFYSQMLSFSISAIVMLIMMKNSGKLSELVDTSDSRILEKDMRKYGSSMLLYSSASWINNALDRYFVLALCGSAINGLYGVAYKIPAILTVLQRIFAQAWQISATKNYSEEDGAEYFSNVYAGYQAILTIGCSGLILFTKLVAKMLFAKDFYQAWNLVPPLLISVVFGALTGFLGSINLAYKDGKSMGYATGIGALVNIVLNSVGIIYFKAMGAALATMISYFVMFVFAYYYVSLHVKLNVNRKRDFSAYILLLVQAVCLMTEVKFYYIYNAIILILITAMYGRVVYEKIRRKN